MVRRTSVLLFLSLLSSTASAQNLAANFKDPSPYPGMIFINPQDSSYLAPAIYRSVEAQSQLASPMTVREICREDFRKIRALRELRDSESSVVPGFHDVATKEFGAKLAGLNLRVLEVGGEFQYADRSSVSTSSLKVVGAVDEDYIAEKVLRHIGKECRTRIIPKHLRA